MNKQTKTYFKYSNQALPLELDYSRGIQQKTYKILRTILPDYFYQVNGTSRGTVLPKGTHSTHEYHKSEHGELTV